MILTYFLILLGGIPMVLFLFAVIEHRHYHIIFRQFLLCASVWAIVYGIATVINFHYWTEYQLPFLPKWEEVKIMLFVVAAMFAIVVIICITVGLINRTAIRDWIAVQGKIFLLIGALFLNTLVIFIFIMPAGQKHDYSVILERANDQFQEVEHSEKNPIAAVLATSQQNCYVKLIDLPKRKL